MVNELGDTKSAKNVLMIHHRLFVPLFTLTPLYLFTSRPATDRLRFDIEHIFAMCLRLHREATFHQSHAMVELVFRVERLFADYICQEAFDGRAICVASTNGLVAISVYAIFS